MNKKEFLDYLRTGLRRYESDEVEALIAYYEELISDMTDGGISETEAIASFGEPKALLGKVSSELLLKPKNRNPLRVAMMILAICLSPLFLPLAIVALTLYAVFFITSASLVIGFGAACLGCAGYAIVSLIAGIAGGSFLSGVMQLGLGLIGAALFALLTIGVFKGGMWLLSAVNDMFTKRIDKKRIAAKAAEEVK